MKRGKNEKVWFCLEAGWKIWYDYGKAADLGNPVKMNKTGENDMKNKLRKGNCEGTEQLPERIIEKYGRKTKI
ncbi:MAG: hypothetical protein EGQ98_02800 [Clostridium sp.]|nr:hypothetical protein [Clostridium sp.]